jgi:hypothetical protein
MSTNKSTPTENDNILKNGNTLNINKIQKYKHMKKINLKILSFIILTLMLSFSCERNEPYSNANTVIINGQGESSNYVITAEEAGSFAANFMNKRRNLKSVMTVKKTKDFNLPIKNRKLFVVQFEPNGFVLMSDNMKNIPVLAFSEIGTFEYSDFEQLPIGMKEWISESILLNYELESDSLLQRMNDIIFEWETNLPKLKSTNIIDPDDCHTTYLGHSQDIFDACMLQTHWNQRLPYSLNTPTCSSDGTHTPAGCVAVAMAQVMNFWGHPSSFNWDILQNTYPTYSTTTSAYEVARLMKDIGTRVNMDYGCDGSSASSNKAKKVLDDDFSYSNNITYTDFNIDKIVQNLQWGYPVILGGYRTRNNILNIYWYTNGHTWVCDGLWEEYDNFEVNCPTVGGTPLISNETRNYRYYLHMNWGWGSTLQNVWYFSNNLTHPLYSDNDYQWKKDMIINIHP